MALVVLLVVGFLVGLTLFLVGYIKPKSAGIFIETNPVSTVIIDGQQVGKTPYDATRKPGEVTVKLVPLITDRPLSPFETKTTLSSGIKTMIKRDFGDSEENSAGEIVSFEKIGGSDASRSVVSIPDAVQISIDGQVRGFAPYKTSSISIGEHQIILQAPGYVQRIISGIRTYAGYKLVATVKLAPGGEVQSATSSAEEKPKEEKKTIMVEILTTPTGFLRVRNEASAAGAELTRVKPGDKFIFIEEDSKSGWFKIEYLPALPAQAGQTGEKAKQGWVSNQYSKKIESITTSASGT